VFFVKEKVEVDKVVVVCCWGVLCERATMVGKGIDAKWRLFVVGLFFVKERLLEVIVVCCWGVLCERAPIGGNCCLMLGCSL